MAYPRNLLTDGETIEYEMRQHWRVLIGPILVAVVTIPIAVYLVTLSTVSAIDWVILAALVVALVIWVLKPVVEWATTEYVITNRRLITRSGVLARSGRDMPMSKVNDVRFSSNIVDRVFRCGTITIESAGENSGIVMEKVGDVERMQREIARLHEEDATRRRREAE
jgi:uncharacterized membrane protein YdbT with pleckstrin-like domain